MKNKRYFYAAGAVLCLIAVVFAAVALTHPELSFPWKNRVSYVIYALYAICTVTVFLIPGLRKEKNKKDK